MNGDWSGAITIPVPICVYISVSWKCSAQRTYYSLVLFASLSLFRHANFHPVCDCVSRKSKGHTRTHRLPTLILFASFHAFSRVYVRSGVLPPQNISFLILAHWRYCERRRRPHLTFLAHRIVVYSEHIIINHFRWFSGISRSFGIDFSLSVFGRLVAWLVDWTDSFRSFFLARSNAPRVNGWLRFIYLHIHLVHRAG